MPIVSKRQSRAMHAAAGGSSTLGIPRDVGKDFVAAGQASPDIPETAPSTGPSKGAVGGGSNKGLSSLISRKGKK